MSIWRCMRSMQPARVAKLGGLLRGSAPTIRGLGNRHTASVASPNVMKDTQFAVARLSADSDAPSVSTPTTSARDFLHDGPRGAYTTARTVNCDNIFELSFHIDRLAQSSQLMIGEETNGDKPVSDAVVREITDAAKLREPVMRCLRSAVLSHVGEMPPRPQAPVKVQVRGEPRNNALAKDSQWVVDRLVLNQPPYVNELVLMGEGGQLMEGTTSNFFAVQDGTVVTARDGILEGTVREVILQVCERNSIPVRLEPPNVADMQAWQGCFISSTSRLLLPVDHLAAPDLPGIPEAEYSYQGTLVRRLEQLVLDDIASCSEPMWD